MLNVTELRRGNAERYRGNAERYRGNAERYRGNAERYRTVPINAEQCRVTPMVALIEREGTDQMPSNRREEVRKK